MASFDSVNYSLRPSKSIQRQLIFGGINKLREHLDLDKLVYIGFGSIWFTDFVLAHKLLGVEDMISIESDDIGFSRAVFNSPYATVRILHGSSSALLPTLYEDKTVRARPWLVWLDYDRSFDETAKGDLVSIIENAPPNSILLVTFNGHARQYGTAQDRPDRLRELFGAAVPDDLPKEAFQESRMQETLADLTRDFMQSTANDLARPGGFVSSFRLIYRDNAPMITVGGILPARGATRLATQLVNDSTWHCKPEKPIIAPHLTIREAAVLQSQLPSGTRLGRDAVRALGFDLEEEQIEAFENYYRYYPAFAQIVM